MAKKLTKTFRLWWQKPRNIHDAEEDRSISFLELFYDLAYVVIIAELTHAFVKHPSIPSLFSFIALFTLIWWAWVNGTFYHELHGNYDIRTRVFTFLQMFALVGMAIFTPTVLSGKTTGFALSYTTFLAIITFLWWRTGVHDPGHRPVSQPYVTGFLVTTILFAISAFTTRIAAYYMWGVGTVLSLLLPLTMLQGEKKLDHKHVQETQRVRPSIVERFGLLTIIVLGEVIVAVTSGLLHHEKITFEILVQASLGLGIAIALWWIYFDFASHHIPKQKTIPRFSWIYLHLPMTIAITLTGAGILKILEHQNTVITANEKWLVTAPITIFLLCIAALVHTLDIDESHTEIHRKGAIGSLVSAAGIFAISFSPLSATKILLVVTALLLLPISLAVRMWIKGLQRTHSHT